MKERDAPVPLPDCATAVSTRRSPLGRPSPSVSSCSGSGSGSVDSSRLIGRDFFESVMTRTGGPPPPPLLTCAGRPSSSSTLLVSDAMRSSARRSATTTCSHVSFSGGTAATVGITPEFLCHARSWPQTQTPLRPPLYPGHVQPPVAVSRPYT